MKILPLSLAAMCLCLATLTSADTTVPLFFTADQGVGAAVGSIVLSETKYGVLLTPDLKGLPPGIHGFHLHQNPSCDNKGMAAGGHFDPQKTEKHLGAYSDSGHLGDLPALTVNADGTAKLPVLAPRIKHLSELTGHALMIHLGGDNYADQPEKLGGGGPRLVCGVIGQ
jgi:Cu-Zn family superoxide dismutase